MQRHRSRYLGLALLPAIAGAALLIAFLLRFEFVVPQNARLALYYGVCTYIPIKSLCFYLYRLHRSSWQGGEFSDVFKLLGANLSASLFAGLTVFVVVGPSFPRSVYIIDGILCFLLTAAFLFGGRLYKEAFAEARSAGKGKPILIYGAGVAGLTVAKEIRGNPRLGMKVKGFLDDNPGKQGLTLAGARVLGSGRDAARIVTRYQRRRCPIAEMVIAMPSANGRQMRTAIANCRAAGLPFRTVPGVGELLNGKVLTSQIREVSVNDLLGREPVRIDERIIEGEIAGKNVLVTGAAGSIGSELCRQLMRFKPRKLVMFDQAESELFMLNLELRQQCPDLTAVQEIGDIRNASRVDEVMSEHSVQCAFHAAAYKHVPMMEKNLLEAVENNIIGTYNVAQAAYRHKLTKFVMISSDKAVNPTSIMGVTKRIAELLVSAMPLDGGPKGTVFVSVRFGNVLGSKGSVIPIFKQQIVAGGPITITHEEMRRYFMSIPEAVLLLLQASAIGKGREIFVLDMGEPVRILDLARNMIRLAGLVPDEDIEIRFSGLRPGEKLFEELKTDKEDVLPTFHEKIKIFRSPDPSSHELALWLRQLNELLRYRDQTTLKRHMLSLVPEYQGTIPWMDSEKLAVSAHA
jgi:FlaA1/EpsC-like NDP-sugar epimerase